MSDINIPGNPGDLEALAAQLRTAAGTVQTVKAGVADDLSDWTGTAATAFRAVMEQFVPGFQRADAALDYGSTAVSRFAAQLEVCQQTAAQYGREIDAAQEALDNASARLAAAEHAVEREVLTAASNPLHAFSGAVDVARAEYDTVNSLVDRCTLDLREWLSKASSNYGVYEDAVRTCASAISDLVTGTNSNIYVRNGDIHIQAIGDGTLSLAALNTTLSADMQAWAAANPSTNAESAIVWATKQSNWSLHDNWDGLCLSFVTAAYGGVHPTVSDSLNAAFYATGDEYPDNFWDNLKPGAGERYPPTGTWASIDAANAHLTGPASGSPPAGAFVFFQSPGYRAHVVLSLGDGKLVSTPDGWGDQNGYKGVVHRETMSDHPASTYIGWWLPPQ
jgi:uncharacterized protein YukE